MSFSEFFAPPGGIPSARRLKIYFFLKLLACFTGGVLYAAALPPFNWTPAAGICLLPLLCCLMTADTKTAALCGWVWGLGWSLFAFQFLREIEWIVPYLLAPILSLWPALFAALIPFLRNHTLRTEGSRPLPEQPFGRLLLFWLGTAALFVFLEWTRSRLFPWNDFSVTLWRVPVLLKISVLTGHYGVNFLVLLANTALAALLFHRSKSLFLLLTALILAAAGFGVYTLSVPQKVPTVDFSPALIQGNLSQRRHATLQQAREALDVYAGSTVELLKKGPAPQVVIWPEGAVPIPFYSAYDLSLYRQENEYGKLALDYQQQVKEICRTYQVPLFIGALDFEDFLPGTRPGATNSALLFDTTGKMRAKYDKLHRVPFGEYIPFRSLLPGSLIRYIDMGRDLVPGRNRNPVELNAKIRSGTAICYEGVFSYVMRNFARRGANVFIVLSNDAWYPRSSEPEQHLANAVLRSVETGLPMIRCGNNGGSGVVLPDGSFRIIDPTGSHPRPELARCKAAETITVKVPADPPMTIYVRYGEWFILLLVLILLGWGGFALNHFFRQTEKLAEHLNR